MRYDEELKYLHYQHILPHDKDVSNVFVKSIQLLTGYLTLRHNSDHDYQANILSVLIQYDQNRSYAFLQNRMEGRGK